MKRKLSMLAAVLCASPAFAATTWDANLGAGVTTDAANHVDSGGTITFNDWGHQGPTVGGYTVGGDDFHGGSGFDSSSIGQFQHVVTKSSDYLTPGPGQQSGGGFRQYAFINSGYVATVPEPKNLWGVTRSRT